ncbi:protein serine/threonine phosphatase 2C family protein [Phanerochaete sordida]|uniref:Protein serine/threonine phosphatase 2C family protein n=1 Tax=Phanerochaete sordida TaxID=48140 RepID=A0A9P3G4I3_9APHY|nr:protein serine/threonine phosphatase 2C family protein [Phanerochaete sordida]
MLRHYSHLAFRYAGRRRLIPTAAGLAVLGAGSATYCFSNTARIHLDTDREAGRGVLRKEVHPRSDLTGIEAKLRRVEHTQEYGEVTGIRRYDAAALPSNDPMEDCSAMNMYAVPDGYHTYFGLFDGHNGPQTSNWLVSNLMLALLGSMCDLWTRVKASAPDADPTVEDFEKTFKETFQRVDDQIVLEAAEQALAVPTRDEGVELLTLAYAGSCATVAFYDSHSRLLHVGVVGDSRAVLGRRVALPDGRGYVYEVRELTVDQNGWNPAEQSRLLAQHPGEHVVENGRVMGWGVSRAFGDAAYKWPLDLYRRLAEKYLAYPPGPDLKTPPYLIAEPEVTTTKVEPGDFLIIASDGLWEWLTSEDAVGLVGWWLDARASDPTGSVRQRGRQPLLPKDLPVTGDYDPNAVRIRTPKQEPRFVNKDENAATHLLRNALGGADERRLAALLSIEPGPECRRRRDDITTQVVFFS